MPSFDVEDTIAAIASAPGAALRGIIRISGPQCLDCLQQAFVLTNGDSFANFTSATSLPVVVGLPGGNELPGDLLYWPTRRSYTRQPSAEFHTIGSPPLLKQALSSICRAGARLAQPGEFTLRAFLSGRLDLMQAEAVLAIIDAHGETQLSGALKQLAGGLTGPLTNARNELTYVLAELEAGLDFVEEDIEFISRSDLVARLESVQETLQAITDQIASRELTTGAIKAALIGLPNAGKSSLFNQLIGHRRAIVTNIAGTTTDFLTAPLEIGGLRIDVIDTAGREDRDEANLSSASISEQAQQQRGFVESTAQLHLLCLDGSRPLSQWEAERLKKLKDSVIVVQTKADLPIDPSNLSWIQQLENSGSLVVTSCQKSRGIEELCALIREFSMRLLDSESEIVGATVLRAAESLRAAEQSVNLALQAATEAAGEEIVAAEIRQALDNLGLVIGTVYTDDILDLVFGRFCIGK
jgi:tRNA modification GTPase